MERVIVGVEICLDASSNEEAYEKVKNLLKQAGLDDFDSFRFDHLDEMIDKTFLIDDVV